jgi:hypothetical protein
MRLAAVSILSLFLAAAAVAQLTPGGVVRSGEPFPVVADFNGDGLDDLIQEHNVVLNDGVHLTDVRDLGLPPGERVVGVLDVNRDHIPDLLTLWSLAAVPPWCDPQGAPAEPRYRLYLGNAARQYTAPSDVTTGPQPYVADVDGDGADDFVLMKDIRPDGFRSVATEVTILRSRGDGTFERLVPFRIPESPQVYPEVRLLAGDVDHDGVTDLVIRCVYDLVILHGTGGGAFTVESRYLPQDMQYGWWSTRLADVDGDSNLDVIMAGFRNLRVFFGNGRGGFPRTTLTSIAKLHDAVGLAFDPGPGVNKMNQPRDLAVGHFTRSDQMQIAAGMGEGDLVVFGWEQGALREVSRTSTEFWLLTVRPGTFHRTGLDDVYVMGTLIWGDVYPRPRVFNGAPGGLSTSSTPAPAGRVRASRPLPSAESSLAMQIRGECFDEATERWQFARDGAFGRAQSGETVIETVFDGPLIYFRLTAPYAKAPVMGILTEDHGSYSGTAQVWTSCGMKNATVTAKIE